MCEHCNEMRDKFHELDKNLGEFMASVTGDLKYIKDHVTRTNGKVAEQERRIAKQENWKFYTNGSIVIIVFISSWFWYDYMKNRDNAIRIEKDVEACLVHVEESKK